MISTDKHGRKMKVDELKHLADNLFWQAVHANSYRHVLKQYKENRILYGDEMDCSPAFYSIVYRSLSTSLVLLLSRIYDRDSKSLTITSLLNGMNEMTEDDLNPKIRETYDLYGGKLHHQLKPIEEYFFEKEVQEKKQIVEIFGYEYKGTTVYLPLQEYVKLYQKRFRELKKTKVIDNLIEQRNKIVAHNDSSTNFDSKSVFESFPVSNDDVELLLDFAIDCTQFVMEILTGTHTMPEYVNIDDWEGSLHLIRIGMKYKETYVKELLEESFKESSL